MRGSTWHHPRRSTGGCLHPPNRHFSGSDAFWISGPLAPARPLWHHAPMPKRTGRKPARRDVNQMARAVLDHIEQIADENPGKNPAAVALGRRGGLKGGKARMGALSPD